MRVCAILGREYRRYSGNESYIYQLLNQQLGRNVCDSGAAFSNDNLIGIFLRS